MVGAQPLALPSALSPERAHRLVWFADCGVLGCPRSGPIRVLTGTKRLSTMRIRRSLRHVIAALWATTAAMAIAVPVVSAPPDAAGGFLTRRRATLDLARIRTAEVRVAYHTHSVVPRLLIDGQYLYRQKDGKWCVVHEQTTSSQTPVGLEGSAGAPNTDTPGMPMFADYWDGRFVYRFQRQGSPLVEVFTPRLQDYGDERNFFMRFLCRFLGYGASVPVPGTGMREDEDRAIATTISGEFLVEWESVAALFTHGLPTVSTTKRAKDGVLVSRCRYSGWKCINGVWLPDSMVHEQWVSPDGKPITGPLGHPTTTSRFSILAARINEPVGKDAVTFEIQEGTPVVDHRFGTPVRYAFRKGITDAELLKLAEEARRTQMGREGRR